MMLTGVHDRDVALLKGLKNSDASMIQEIYDMAFPRIDIMVRKAGGTRHDAQDVFQDALMALYQRLQGNDFHLSCKLTSYLQVVSRNLWKSKTRRKSMKSLDESTEMASIGADADFFAAILRRDKQRLLQKHFNSLGEDCKRILTLFFNRVPMKKIAEELNSTEGYMKKRKFVCKNKLIEKIKADPLYDELQYD